MPVTTINIINPALLTWARERAGIDRFTVLKRFPQFQEWESGSKKPTLRQLEKFANFVHAICYLFLPEPPLENLPIADFRTVGSQPARRPSPIFWILSTCVSNAKSGIATMLETRICQPVNL
ncbi:MAG: hypothetical protein IJT59_03135 [Desulfovibrionaceae bacterium]|nr:hypothetical protein [Desulfovibrionaceae bacterium]